MIHSWLILTIFLLFHNITPITSRSTGADLLACIDQNPIGKDGTNHIGPITPGNGGYSIVIPNGANPSDGDPISITITGQPFLGFLISALPKTVAATQTNYVGNRLGTWVDPTNPPTNLVQPYNCAGDIANSAMTHTSANTKYSVVLQWTPPPKSNTSITLVATVVASLTSAWMITTDFPTTPVGPSQPGIPTIPYPYSATTDSLNITWTRPKGSAVITTYVIQIDNGTIMADQTQDVPNPPFHQFETNSSNPFAVISNLTSGFVYRIGVAAKNDVGTSAFTSFLSARVLRTNSIPPTLPSSPITPLSIPPNLITPAQITIIWNTNTVDQSLSYANLQGETLISFQVEKILGNDLNNIAVIDTVRLADIRAATFPGLSYNDSVVPNSTYQYRITTTTLAGSISTPWVAVTSATCLNACSGHGVCTNTGTCQCDDGWLGTDCSLSANYLYLGNRRILMEYASDHTSQTPYVYVRLTGPPDRWFGVMLNPDAADGMKNGDAWITSFSGDGTKLFINDYYSTGQVTPTSDAKNDLITISSSVGTTSASIVFKRLLNTQDSQDAVISTTKGNYMRLSWAIGSSTVFIQHDRGNYGKAKIDWIGSNAYELDYSLKYGTFYLPIIIGLGVCIITGLLLRFPRIYRSPIGRLLLRSRVPPPLTAPTAIDKLTFDVRPTMQTLSIGEGMIVISYFACFAGMIGYGYQQFLSNARDPRYVWGHVTAVHIALTWLPVTKNSVWLYVFGIPFERAIHYHRMIARMTLICIYIHLGTMLDIWGYSIVTSTNSTYGGNGVLYGFIAMLIFSSIIVLALEPIRRFSYEWFVYPHFILNKTATVFAMIHSVYLRWFLLVPLALWGWDQLVGIVHVLKYTQPIESLVRVPSEGDDAEAAVSILHVRVPSSFKYRPGDYCYLQFPSINQSQWHPFSISTSPSLNKDESQLLTFHMLDMGKGTFTHDVANLATKLKQENIQKCKVKIDGPYGRLMIPVYEYPHLILVAGGVGATPMISILSDLFTRYQAGQLQHLQSVHFIWCSRSPVALTTWFKELFSQLQNHTVFKLYLHCSTQKQVAGNPQIQVRPPSREKMMAPSAPLSEDSPCCVTELSELSSGPKAAPPSPPDVASPPPEIHSIAIHGDASSAAGHHNDHEATPTSTPIIQKDIIPIYAGRPNMTSLFKSIHNAYPTPAPGKSGNAWGVCACGPPPLVASTRQLAYLYDCDWHEETFTI